MPVQDRSLDNLIRGTEELIRDLAGGAGTAPVTLSEAAPAELEDRATSPLEPLVEASVDGTVTADVSRDEMIVRARFHPHTGGGRPVSLEAAQKALAEKGILFGIDWNSVKGCIVTCNEQGIEVADAVVARGRRPVDECPPFLVISEKLARRERAGETASARVDFKELSLFTLVKKGDLLATREPKRDGIMGTSVRGNSVAFGHERIPSPRPGKNTAWQEGSVVAGCDGRFQVDSDSFWVDQVLEIHGDLDLRVGNIDFPGDVVIHGEIRDGFSVKVGRSLLCTGCIGAARVECKGDLVTQQGIVGKEKASIVVGGIAEAKFLEACVLDAGGPVRVKTSVLNCTVHTSDRLDMGERGMIIGGVVKAQNGVSAAQVGSERGPKTEIHCGLDFKVEQKLVWIRDRNIALAGKLKEVEGRMKAGGPARDVLSPLRDRIKASIHQLNENARLLVAGLDRNEQAHVAIRGFVYPGTYVEICHVSHFVTKPRRFVTFRLDKTSGKIVEAGFKTSGA
jgi:uncharacterized protein